MTQSSSSQVYTPTKFDNIKLRQDKIDLVESNAEKLNKLGKTALALLCEILQVPYVQHHTIANTVNTILKTPNLNFAAARSYLQEHHLDESASKSTAPKRKAAPATLPPNKKPRLDESIEHTAKQVVQNLQGKNSDGHLKQKISSLERTIEDLQDQLKESQSNIVQLKESLGKAQAASILTPEQQMWLDVMDDIRVKVTTTAAKTTLTSDANPSDIKHFIILPDKSLPVTQERFVQIKNAKTLRKCARILATIADLDLQNGCLKVNKSDQFKGKTPWDKNTIDALVNFAMKYAIQLQSKGLLPEKLRAAFGELASVERKFKVSNHPAAVSLNDENEDMNKDLDF